MLNESIEDFFDKLQKTGAKIKAVYPSISDRQIIIKEGFYPSLKDFLNESEQVKSTGTLIEDCDEVVSPDGVRINMHKLNKDMTIAKVAIINQAPLFGPYVNQFTPIYTFEIPTMATDGVRLFVNPQFADSLRYEQKIFVIIHEIMHCVLNHMKRIKGRNATVMTSSGKPTSLANIAADYEINTLIVDTIPSFTADTVNEMHGLYDIKWLNQSFEQIYDELYKNTPKIDTPPQPGTPGQPPPEGGTPGGGGEGPPPPLKVGDKVRIKKSGNIGVINKINPDGSFEISENLKESFFPRLYEISNKDVTNLRKVTYKREDLIPILPGKPPSGGGGGKGGHEVEYEEEREPGEDEGGEGGEDEGGEGGDGKGGQPKGYKDGKEVKLANGKSVITVDADPGNSGILISEEQGKAIARNAGHEVGDSGDTERKWNSNARKLMDDLNAQSKNGGRGAGGMLASALKKLFKGDVNWQEEFARFIADTLSPDKRWKLGNRRHMRAGQKILRYGAVKQRDNISNVCVIVDVSGSMSDSWKVKILNEVNMIMFSKKVKDITVIFFDGDVHIPSIQKLKRGTTPWIPKNIPGGGGTLFQNPLDYVEKHLKNPSVVVFATDGYNADGKSLRVPNFADKFIWLLYGPMEITEMRKRFPWGKILKIADAENE